jgi:hypothetical protein
MKKSVITMIMVGVLVMGLFSMAQADLVTFNFNPSALPDNSNAAAIGTYMTGIYGSTVTATGHNGPVSEVGLFTLLGGSGDGYIESEWNNPFESGGQNLIQINFATPITSVAFDYGQWFDSFNADYTINGSTWINFFTQGYSVLATGNSGTLVLPSGVIGLRFHDGDYGEVGIDNLVVNRVPEPMSLLLLGLGLLGIGVARRKN